MTLSDFEALDGSLSALLYFGDFETCDDPRGYIRASNRLYDACIGAGMSHDEPDHEQWAAAKVCAELVSA